MGANFIKTIKSIIAMANKYQGNIMAGAPLTTETGTPLNVIPNYFNPTGGIVAARANKARTCTISFASVQTQKIRRFGVEINGVTYERELDVTVAFGSATQYPADAINLREKLETTEQVGLNLNIIGGGANMTITKTGNDLVIVITADQLAYVPKYIDSDDVRHSFT